MNQAGVHEFASAYLTKQLDRVAFQIGATLHRRDADAIHDLRVAIRRFSQGLTAFGGHYASKKPKKMRRFLKQVLAQAGEVRDCDIALQFISSLHSPYAARLRREVRGRRKDAEGKLVQTLKPWVARRRAWKWRGDLEGARWVEVPGSQTPPEIAKREVPRMAQVFFERGQRAARAKSSTEELHQFRLAAKKFRYTLEIFAAEYPDHAAQWLQPLKEVQQLLGRINDCGSFRALLSRLGRHPKLDAAMKRKERRRTAEFRRVWLSEFSDSATAEQWIQALRLPGTSELPPRKPAGRSEPARAEQQMAARA